MDAAPHVRLQAKLAAVEAAVHALLAECQQPDVVATLEVRTCWRCARARGTATHAWRAQMHTPRAMVSNTLLTRRRALFPAARQDRNLGYASAAVAAQLEATRLLARVDGVVDGMHGVRGALLPRHDSAAGCSREARLTFASLPHAVALSIFCKLPADQRVRITPVCRAWRDALADPAAWTVLDLSHKSGVTVAITDATLRAAAARANGRLRELSLDDCDAFTPAVFVDVVGANMGALRTLSCLCTKANAFLSFQVVEALARAAPKLEKLCVDAATTVEQAMRMLHNDSPFEVLELRALQVRAGEERADEAAILALATALPRHKKSLAVLDLRAMPLHTAGFEALCAAAAEVSLQQLTLYELRLLPASVPALVRLIRGEHLQTLTISNNGVQLFDEPAGVQLADALATNYSLEHLQLCELNFWHGGTAIVHGALTGHPTLEVLDLSNNTPTDAAAAGIALGTLVAANSSTLASLSFVSSFLGDVGLGPIFDVLPHNKHLRTFECCNVGMSEDFVRKHFVQAVLANTSLRKLRASEWWGNNPHGVAPFVVRQAEALVAARAATD